jgi:mevalonate kinase
MALEPIARAPFKVILFGEYGVLSGSKCIAFSINRYGYLYMEEAETSGVVAVDKTGNELSLDERLGCKVPGFDAEIVLEASFGCGLGSSAVMSLLLSYAVHGSSSSELLSRAHAFEDIFHGRASGVDVLTSYTGGLICFQSGHAERLPLMHLKKYKILVYDSKASKDTKHAIESSRLTGDTKRKIAEVASEAYNLLCRPFELSELYQLFRRNQELLEELGVCTKELKNEVLRMRGLGIECKITGSGCGGHLVTVVDLRDKYPGWEEVEVDEAGFRVL